MDRFVGNLFKIFVLLFLISYVLTTFFRSPAAPPRAEEPPAVNSASSGLPQPLGARPISAGSSASAATNQPASADLTNVDQNQPVLKATHEVIDFEIQAAESQGSTLNLRVIAVNHGADRLIELSAQPWTKTLIYDEIGEVFRPNTIRVANTESTSLNRSMLISGVPTPIVLIFTGIPTIRGKTQITKIKLFDLDASLFSAAQARTNSYLSPVGAFHASFRNIDIK